MTADPTVLPADENEDDLPEPFYDNVQDWVSDHFIPLYRRPLGGEYRWCPQWWRHGEAVERLTALWQSWEAMRLQPGTGTASWLRDHLDHQIPVLLGRSGPFAQCSSDEHVALRVAAVEPPPPDWWDIDDSDVGEGTEGITTMPLMTPPASAVEDVPDDGPDGDQQ
jgi:hypothetical protein